MISLQGGGVRGERGEKSEMGEGRREEDEEDHNSGRDNKVSNTHFFVLRAVVPPTSPASIKAGNAPYS